MSTPFRRRGEPKHQQFSNINSKVRSMTMLRKDAGPLPSATLETALEHGTEPVAGGHLIWKHGSDRRVKVDGCTVIVQRAVFERRYGPIPSGRFLLNHCLVSHCIAPECHLVTKHARWEHHFRHTHHAACLASNAEPCSGLPLFEDGCQ